MEINLDNEPKRNRRRDKKAVKDKHSIHIREEASHKPHRITPLKAVGLVIIFLLLCLTVYTRLYPEPAIPTQEGVEHKDPDLNSKEISEARLGESDIYYKQGLWEETENGLEAKCSGEGYYRVSFSRDTLLGATLKELAEMELNTYEGVEGIRIGGLSLQDDDSNGCERAEVIYSRIELNHNNIVTGNSEKTREIFIRPLDQKDYLRVTVTSYETQNSDYSVYAADLEEMCQKAVN